MKKIVLSISILFIALIAYLNYDAHFSAEARQRQRNFENLKKIEIGMTKAEVLKIMGKPDSSDSAVENENSIASDLGKSNFSYNISNESHPAAIEFDFNNRVINIYK